MLAPTILLEDNHLLALDKPAGMLSQGDATGDLSIDAWAAADLKRRHGKPGNVYVGLVHRLDRPVSGVILVARTSKAASRLSEQFRAGEVEKSYRAVVEGTWPEDEGEWADTLIKDDRTNVVSVAPAGTHKGQTASLRYQVIDRDRRTTTFRLMPSTGRGHQLRVQLASRGLPILGDAKYGARGRIMASGGGHRIALHAESISFLHPTRREATRVTAGVPADWPGPGR